MDTEVKKSDEIKIPTPVFWWIYSSKTIELINCYYIFLQAPYNLRIAFQKEIQDATNEAAELVRRLGQDISNMQQTLKTSLLKRVHTNTERLQQALDIHSYLLTSNHDPPDTLSKTQSHLSHMLSSTFSNLSNQTTDIDNKFLEQQSSIDHPPQLLHEETYHEMMRKQSRRLHSWPSREVDAFEEGGGFSTDCNPRMRALESTATFSLATFTSLLIEFVARLDHLVEAVDELSKMARFKQESLWIIWTRLLHVICMAYSIDFDGTKEDLFYYEFFSFSYKMKDQLFCICIPVCWPNCYRKILVTFYHNLRWWMYRVSDPAPTYWKAWMWLFSWII